ncbi:MAG: MOLO1 domain-containing protein [Muribaculaceae bacterium]|nr:MOLO1 domain-containing protein [Muribaculaceae bacterium]
MANNTPLTYMSVENIPGLKAAAYFKADSSSVFREDPEIAPIPVSDTLSYMPWGADNQLPYDILDLIEKDETLSTCQLFNAEVCFGAGLSYVCDPDITTPATRKKINSFLMTNDMASYFLGVCQDFKHFGFTISVIILNKEGTRVVRLFRKEACYCRFSPADDKGHITKVLYANWRNQNPSADKIEVIDLLDPTSPTLDLEQRLKKGTTVRKFAIVSRVPTVDSTYYPIPHYAALFRGKWYNIKQYIGVAKEAKLKNTAPIKYHIEIAKNYWESIFRSEGITDRRLQQERIVKEKQSILEFLTGAENSGKAWFSTFYVTPDGKEQHDVNITKVDSSKEGGDWETDIQEAINMICFTLRVHSNLVGSVPGKTQSNNSGSDKRELFTIAQALQKPYRDILFGVHRLIIYFNNWEGVHPECPFIQLTTLDEHKDAKTVSLDNKSQL